MMIKPATLDELREIVDFLIERFHGAYADTLPPVDFGKVVLHIGKHINDGVLFAARDEDGALKGVIAGMVTEPWFSGSPQVSEGVFFVDETARGTGVGAELLRNLKKWARDKRLPLMCGVTTGDDLERKDEFFERNGLVKIGGIYRTKGK